MSTEAIGFLGGSFDPPHLGHLALAHAALDALGLQHLRFVPAGQPWQKPHISAATHRVRMLELMLADTPEFGLDTREVARRDASYTVDTLRALRHELGEHVALVWIIGSDQLARLPTWHQWDTLLTLAHLGVAARPDEPPLSETMHAYDLAHRATADLALQRPHGHIIHIAMSPVPVSATTLRALLARAPQSLSAQEQITLAQSLHPAVLDYIRAHALYH